MSEENSSQQQAVFSLEIPQREGKEGFLGMHFTLMLQMGNLIRGMENQTDHRLQYMTELMISLVPDKKESSRIRKEMRTAIIERTKSNMTNEEKGRETQHVCLETVNEVMSFLDKHVGVSKENKVGFSIPNTGDSK